MMGIGPSKMIGIGAAAEKEARYCFCRGMGRPRYRQDCSALPGNVHQEAGPSGPRSRGQIQDCGPSFNSLNTLLKRVKLEVADWGTGLLSTKVEDCGGGHVPLSDPSYTPLHVQFSFWWQQVVVRTIVRDPTPIFSHAHHL